MSENEKLYKSLFTSLIYTLNMTAMQQLGQVINPLTGRNEKEPEQANLTIEMLKMLAEKTRNNLAADEENFLNQIIEQLSTHYKTLGKP
ncbi:MAG: DUF1844 domain-containing protein [Candidatus Margulisbacteria bacterium]|nr:DUF1844 domain-containing protein [Candidatus Margulisiibacteriota bacterium]